MLTNFDTIKFCDRTWYWNLTPYTVSMHIPVSADTDYKYKKRLLAFKPVVIDGQALQLSVLKTQINCTNAKIKIKQETRNLIKILQDETTTMMTRALAYWMICLVARWRWCWFNPCWISSPPSGLRRHTHQNLSKVCQLLFWWTKNSLPSINIWDTVIKVL